MQFKGPFKLNECKINVESIKTLLLLPDLMVAVHPQWTTLVSFALKRLGC